jgi:3-deoxy-D-arabino-heptulosonate 7-phosphate (DAHP) synthase
MMSRIVVVGPSGRADTVIILDYARRLVSG